MSEETQTPALPTARVATRPGVSRVAETRRRIYQRHLLLFLAVGAGLLAADLYTSPDLQWAYYPLAPWFLVFVMHTIGLKSRGFTIGEMLIPPRERAVEEVYTVPLDYELVRARQLRDGVASAAAAVRDQDASLADRAVSAADDLVAAVESLVSSARSEKYRSEDRAEKWVPEARAGLEALNELHQGLLSVEVLEEPLATVRVEPVEERARLLRDLA